jgi:hypothetical protein
VNENNLAEVQALLVDIRAAAHLLSRGETGNYQGLDDLPSLICSLTDALAGLLGLCSPVELNEGEQGLMQLYRGMSEGGQRVLYRMGLSVRFDPHDPASDEADILAFYRRLGGEGQQLAHDLLGILADEWQLPVR